MGSWTVRFWNPHMIGLYCLLCSQLWVPRKLVLYFSVFQLLPSHSLLWLCCTLMYSACALSTFSFQSINYFVIKKKKKNIVFTNSPFTINEKTLVSQFFQFRTEHRKHLTITHTIYIYIYIFFFSFLESIL